MDRDAVNTKSEADNLAPRRLAHLPMTREEALAMRGVNAIGDVPQDAPPEAEGRPMMPPLTSGCRPGFPLGPAGRLTP
jgi:hypothetical protein